MSNMEAARILLTDHNYDVNILLHEKNFIYDLLNTASWEDFNILSNVFKKRQPCVNSGQKIAINQAILRGNRHIIKTMLEHGKPNPLVRDKNGITPIHVACSKLDWETLKDLVKIGGDPLLPDKDGNTFLHTLCTGHVEDFEYDFVKLSCLEFEMKMTRNS
jgi:ankyrin repeat protein